MIRDHKLKWVSLDPLERISFGRPIDNHVGFIAKPLRVLYPEQRAREIGKPLGIGWWSD